MPSVWRPARRPSGSRRRAPLGPSPGCRRRAGDPARFEEGEGRRPVRARRCHVRISQRPLRAEHVSVRQAPSSPRSPGRRRIRAGVPRPQRGRASLAYQRDVRHFTWALPPDARLDGMRWEARLRHRVDRSRRRPAHHSFAIFAGL